MLRPLIVLMALTFASSEALAQITSNKPKPAPVPTSTDKEDDKETDSPADPVFGEPVTGIDGVEVGGIDIDRSPRVKVTEDESIYVAQRRAYTKKNGFEITPYFVTAMNPKFVGYLGAGLSLPTTCAKTSRSNLRHPFHMRSSRFTRRSLSMFVSTKTCRHRTLTSSRWIISAR